ncbi:hypothetical protein DPMN_127169 [Dreissena polymorpha]|uniref:guanylate cyclase n=1 Tax=Dreissena polymorpha TaxID=45954 RepID=A0A9D4H1G4_DREPO|nr:hypothetical protein DPMN_127169 [Dreissena polymorpha]
MAISAVQFTIGIVILPVVIILVRNIIKLIKKIKNFSEDLQVKTCELEAEKQRTEELLYQLLPRSVAKQLMTDGSTLPESYLSATIMFSDVVGFTSIARYAFSKCIHVPLYSTLYISESETGLYMHI